MLATLDRTDELLVLCGLDVPTLKNVRLALQTLELLSFPSRRIRYVLNRANTKVGLSKREVERRPEGRPCSVEVPSDRIVPISVNRGTPAVLSEPGSDFAKAMIALAKAVMTPAEQAGEAAASSASAWRGAERHGPARPPLERQGDGGTVVALTPNGHRADAAERRRGRPVRGAEGRIHHQCIAKLGPELYKQDSDDLADRVYRAVTEELALDRTPLTREERREIVRQLTDDILGYGPIEPLLRDDSVTEIMVNAPDKRLRRAQRQARAHRRPLRRRLARDADHRQDRLAGRPPRRRGVADGRRAPPRRQPRQRDHPAARAARARR